MRNLKRALSLALASVMLLGMMVIGTSAASNFTDADDIVNTEAAAITSGLGIFAGANGEFMPTKPVTRAEMATIIVKMLYGNDFNANPFKGAEKFSDVASYQGGWAEGYVNLCTNLKVLGGYPDGTFKPGQTVTTAEAASMILSALGLNKNLGEWPVGVIAKATEIKLFGKLTLGANDPLTRDDLSVLVLNGLKKNPEGNTVYPVLHNGSEVLTFDNAKDAALYAAALGGAAQNYTVGTPYESIEGSLADKVFGLATKSGVVTANQATTTNKYTTVGGANFAVETGLDLIGHNVTVYYKAADSAPAAGYTTYAVVDNSKTFEMTSKTTQKDLNAALGVSSNPASYSYTKYNGNYATSTVTANPVGQTGTAIIYNKAVIGFVEPTTYVLDQVTDIVTTAGSEAIKIYNGGSEYTMNNNKTSDEVVEYEGIAKKDIIVRYKVGDIFHLSKAEAITGTPTKISGTKVTIGGVEYDQAGTDRTNLANKKSASEMTFANEYTLYLAPNGKYIAATAKATAAAPTDVVYLVEKYSKTESTDDPFSSTPISVTKYYAQCVDMAGNQVIYQITETAASKIKDSGANTANGEVNKTSLVKVSTAYDSTLKATVATFTSASSSSATLSGGLKTSAVKIADKHYFTSDVKFIYVNGSKGDLKVSVKDGVQELANNATVEYIAEGTATNRTVKYVIVEGAEYQAPTVSGTDVMYLTSDKSTVKVPYTKDNATETGYEFTAYIDGEKKTIIVADDNGDVTYSGFVTYTVSNGVYTITGSNSAANLKSAAAVTNMYNGMISTADVTDLPVAGAVVINLTTNTKVPTDPTALSNKDTVALVLSSDLKSVELIYVTATTR